MKDQQATPKLKPCPFCGCRAALKSGPLCPEIGFLGKAYWVECASVRCAICPNTGNMDTAAEAARDWNKRKVKK